MALGDGSRFAAGVAKIERFKCGWIKISDVDGFVSRTGYTGEDGFEVFIWNSPLAEPVKAVQAWNAILKAGAEFGIRGFIAALDAATGSEAWRFYTVPGDPSKPVEGKHLEAAAKTWAPDAWKNGGGGTVWDSITYDPATNLVFFGTGNAEPWNPAANGRNGDSLYTSSIVAVDADTGEYKWHYQTNPGETWDWGASMDMEFADLTIGGKLRKVLMTAPKNGFFYVIDRTTGELISAEKIARASSPV